MENVSYVTAEGLKKLKEELDQLERVERPNISKQIAEARDKGDLSENAEYDAAKEAQGMLEMKISKLKEAISKSKVIDESKLDNSSIRILHTVVLKNNKMKKEQKYTIVPKGESNIKEGKISVDTPIAKALLGKKVGDKVDVKTPSGLMNLEILEINV